MVASMVGQGRGQDDRGDVGGLVPGFELLPDLAGGAVGGELVQDDLGIGGDGPVPWARPGVPPHTGDRERSASACCCSSTNAATSGSFLVPASRKDPAMNADETTRTFLEFFAERGHQVIEGGSLIPPG